MNLNLEVTIMSKVNEVESALEKQTTLGEFKVGQVWKTRAGDYVTITEVDNDYGIVYPIFADNKCSYTSCGLCWKGDLNSEDLVELVADVKISTESLSEEEEEQDNFQEEHIIKRKGDTIKIYAKENSGYSPHVKGEVLFKLKDTGNGYISKQYSHSCTHQDHYLCMDYDEAEYLYQALKVIFESNSK